MKMRFLPDTPIQTKADDLLEFHPFVKLIKTSLQMTEPPFVYGILGDWGTGKTSILHLLKEQFAEERAIRHNSDTDESLFIPIWFNAWKYENEANIIYPLLYAIKQAYDSEVNKLKARSLGQTFTEVVATSFYLAGDIGLKAVTKKLTDEAVGLKNIEDQMGKTQDKLAKELEMVMTSWSNQVDMLDEQFSALLMAYAKDIAHDPQQVRFVILIDDLDRCLPETTVAILENIKNYLSVEQCIFVLALNATVVYQGIRVKYKGLEIDGREYLEKILNYSFYVPEPALDKVKLFASQRLEQLIPNQTDRQTHETYFTKFGEVLEACHFNNPRKIKRILNRFLLFLGQGNINQYNVDNIIRLMVLAEYYPILFSILQDIPNTEQREDFIDKIMTSQITANVSFEHEYGFIIPPTYPPLSRIRELFNLVTSGQSPHKEIEAVHQITRLV